MLDPPTGCSGAGIEQNDIVFVESGWTRKAWVIAETASCVGLNSGRMYGADILLNASDYRFVVADRREPGARAYDLESVLMHEVDHALGLKRPSQRR